VGVIGARQLAVVFATIVLYLPALRLALSKKQGRELIVLLQYSARAQLALGALLGVLLASNSYWG
jgi:hypothetical protein